jgi:hypothetical protein
VIQNAIQDGSGVCDDDDLHLICKYNMECYYCLTNVLRIVGTEINFEILTFKHPFLVLIAFGKIKALYYAIVTYYHTFILQMYKSAIKMTRCN